jgi:hypothetical protein
LDLLAISDKPLPHLKEKYDYPVSIEVQPTMGYDKIYLHEAISEGEILYDEGIVRNILADKITKKDITLKLDEVGKTLLRLEDEKLSDSLSLRDLAQLLHSSLRTMGYVKKNLKLRRELKANGKTLQAIKALHSAAKSKTPLVPDITRKELTRLRKTLIDEWAYLKAKTR